MHPERRAYLELHLAVLLFGFTAILGKLISLSAIMLVWWRVLLTALSLLLLINVGRLFRTLPNIMIWRFIGIGVLVAFHWITFFGSVKLSNSSITLVCMATTSFFTAFLEPLILKQKVKWYEIMLGMLIIPGMALVVGSIEVEMLLGVYVGLASAFTASLFAILNKKYISVTKPLNITFIELSSACLVITLILPFFFQQNETASFWPSATDWGYLIFLALVCTTLAYVLALKSLKYLSAFASNLTVNLEPVYGILMAIVILKENEELSSQFYIGVIIILLSVFSYPYLRRMFEKKPENGG